MHIMKKIKHTSSLFYYDGVQIFEGLDDIGGHYIALLVDSGDDGDRYVIVGVSPEKLREFRSGSLELRELFTNRVAGMLVW
jgi:hypothetical protein